MEHPRHRRSHSSYLVTITSVATAVATEASADAIAIHFIVLSAFTAFLGTIISDPGVMRGLRLKIKPFVEAVVPLG